jgi:hypothetical protein
MTADRHGFLSSIALKMARVLLAAGTYYLFTLTWADLPSAVMAVVLWTGYSTEESS